MLIRTIERGKYANIHIERVVYVTCEEPNHAVFHMEDKGSIAVRMTLEEVHKLFPKLVRPSKSYLFNESFIRGIRHDGKKSIMKTSTQETFILPTYGVYYPSFFSSLSSSNGGDEGEDI